jgi:hypothetical protein
MQRKCQAQEMSRALLKMMTLKFFKEKLKDLRESFLLVIFADAVVALCMLALTNELCKPLIVSDNNQLEILLSFAVLHNSAHFPSHFYNHVQNFVAQFYFLPNLKKILAIVYLVGGEENPSSSFSTQMENSTLIAKCMVTVNTHY